MTTALAIPKKISTHQPKPTKSQLVEALVERARIAHAKENEARGIKQQAIETQVKLEAQKLFHASRIGDFDFHIHQWHGSCDYSLSIESPKIKKLVENMSKFDSIHFDHDATKKKIVESLKTPNPLLEGEDTAKALDQLLERIMNIKPAIEA